jgi:Fe-S-cluster containining protein
VYVEVTEQDLERLPAKYALKVVDGELATVRRKQGVRCVALKGVLGETVYCDMHEQRPSACRAFEAGSGPCLDARKQILGRAEPEPFPGPRSAC